MKKKLGVFSFAIVLFVLIIFTKDSQAATLAQLQTEYPTGSHWYGSYTGLKRVDDDGYARVVATECAGFAATMYNRYYGIDPYEYARETNDINEVQPGDIVRYANNGHSVWVVGRSGSTVQVAECNYDSNGSVRWFQTKTLGELSYGLNYIYKAPYVLTGSMLVTEPEPEEPEVVIEEQEIEEEYVQPEEDVSVADVENENNSEPEYNEDLVRNTHYNSNVAHVNTTNYVQNVVSANYTDDFQDVDSENDTEYAQNDVSISDDDSSQNVDSENIPDYEKIEKEVGVLKESEPLKYELTMFKFLRYMQYFKDMDIRRKEIAIVRNIRYILKNTNRSFTTSSV